MKDVHPLRRQGGKAVLMSTTAETAQFMNVVTKYTELGKMALYDHIFKTGFAVVFGISCEELVDCEMTPPPRETAAPFRDDYRKLTDLICGEPEDG